jgi:hypothetical protein
MLEKLRARIRRTSPSTGIALLALFVALGGTGYAALKLPKNSVGTAQLKSNAVTGAKVKNGSLTAGDFGGTLPAGAQGPKGDTGPKGDAGTNGTNGTNGTKGDKGDPGTDGTDGAPAGSLKPKITGGPQDSGAENVTQTLSLTPFTPAANKAELVQFRITWTPPPMGCTPAVGVGGASVTVKLDGEVVATPPPAPATGPTQLVTGNASIISSATPTAHTFSVDITDNCQGSQNATINSATVEPVEFG